MAVRPDYKQTEVGVIPDEWDTQTIAQASRKIQDYRGRTPKKLGMDWGGGDIPALSAGNVKMGFIDFDEECYLASESLYKRWMVNGDIEQGDIVFTMEAPLGNVALIPDNRRYILSQRTVLLQPNSETIYSPFLYQVLMSHRFQRQLVENATGSTAQGIQRKKFEKLSVVCPPLPEQRAIAAALSDVDALLAKLDQLIAKKRDLRQAAMQQLLTGQTRLPGFHGEWGKGKLSSFVRSHNSGVYKKSELYGQGSHIVGVSDIYGVDCIDGQTFTQVPLSVAEKAKHTLRTNDLLYGESSLVREGIARTVYVTERGAGTAFAWHTRRYSVDQSRLMSSFLNYYLQGRRARQHMMDNCIQTAITGINTVAYFACPVLLPPLPEQTAIATVLSDMDAEIIALEARRDKTRALKQGMMQELLTGRIRLV